jgi:excisionase family DNA binding protein
MDILGVLVNAACWVPLAFGAYITTKQAAKLLGLNQRHVSRLVKEGKLKGEPFGHVYMVDENSVREYSENRPKPGPKPKATGNPQTRGS